jgi:predicted nucleic acid-binding protein
VRLRLYLDTSVLGALTDPGPEERLVATRRFLDGLSRGLWDGYMSTVLLEEVERAPRSVREKIGRELRKGYMMVLEESDESVRLSRVYIAGGAIPSEYENDARHIAIATVNDIG